jgi:CPA2 family monovalent cation:H+ antiporter-2
MHGMILLLDLLIIVGIAIPVVALAHRLRTPSVVGFLLTGVAIGPHALGLVRDTAAVSELAEIGVVLLLFAIGLEISLSRVIKLGRIMVQGGFVQVGLTMLVTGGIALAFSLPTEQAVFYASLAALSSTAVVLRAYSDRRALDTPPGRASVGILLFQDLSIVALVLLVQVLGGTGTGAVETLLSVLISLVVVGTLVLAGRFVIPWVLEQVVGVQNRELFTLGIVFFGLGAAYVTASFGLSLALGAFIAGLVISESEYGLQALSDILPFRDVFSGVFFTSIGMLLDLGFLLERPGVILAIAASLFLIKTAAGTLATLSLKRSFQVSLITGLGLAQVGEFSFVLASVAEPFGLMGGTDREQIFLGVSVLTLLATPLVIIFAPAVARWTAGILGRPPVDLPTAGLEEPEELSDHVIIIGYGVNGRNLARVLDGAGIPYIILEQNGLVVQSARRDLQPIVFGDGTQPEVLEEVGVQRARILVLAIASPAAELRGVSVARRLNSGLRIIVRTRFVLAVEDLKRAGADEVVAEEFETSLEIFARTLRHYSIPSNAIERELQAARLEHYGIFSGRGTAEFRLDTLAELGVHRAIDIVEVEAGAPAVGQHPSTLRLRRETGATVIAVVREEQVYYTPDPKQRFQVGDSVLLMGDEEAQARVRKFFVTPPTPL